VPASVRTAREPAIGNTAGVKTVAGHWNLALGPSTRRGLALGPDARRRIWRPFGRGGAPGPVHNAKSASSGGHGPAHNAKSASSGGHNAKSASSGGHGPAHNAKSASSGGHNAKSASSGGHNAKCASPLLHSRMRSAGSRVLLIKAKDILCVGPLLSPAPGEVQRVTAEPHRGARALAMWLASRSLLPHGSAEELRRATAEVRCTRASRRRGRGCGRRARTRYYKLKLMHIKRGALSQCAARRAPSSGVTSTSRALGSVHRE
jgi:hypothetical protein